MNTGINNDEMIAEFKEKANHAINQAQEAIVGAKVWFYKTTGISLVTPNEINKKSDRGE